MENFNNPQSRGKEIFRRSYLYFKKYEVMKISTIHDLEKLPFTI